MTEMTGEEKMFSILGCAFMSAVIIMSISFAYYYSVVETAAIKAGLVQRVVEHRVIWTKPE